ADMLAADDQHQVRRALAELPERQREAIVLQYYQELSNSDAAEVMGISIEALESLLSRARRQLRSRLGRDRDEMT
ncbi:MAG: sigma-70 family RNA polymerase sigma factor, partial [Mesorhizobium sp.]